MAALLDDPAVPHHQDHVRLTDRGEPVRNDKCRAPFHQLRKCILDLHLRPGINGRGRLVKNQHRRPAKHHAGNAQKLLLSLGQSAAIFRDPCVVPVRQPPDETVDMGRFRRRDHFFLRSVRASHGNIVTDRSGLQPGVLEHHAVPRTQALPGHLADIMSLHGDRTVLHVIEPHKQVDKRGLAAAGRPDDGDPLSGLHIQIEITDQLLPLFIREIHMFRLYITLYMVKCHRILRLRRLRLFFDQVKDPLGACHRVLELRHHTGDLIERLRILIGVTQETGELADRQRAVYHAERTGDPDACINKAVDKTGGRISDRREKCRLQGRLPQPFVDLIKLLCHLLSPAECLDHFLVLHHLIDQARLLSADLRLQPEHGEGPSRDKVCHQERDRCDQHHDKRDHHIYGQHEAERSHDRRDPGKKLGETHQKAIRKLIHVRDHPAHHLAVGPAVNIFQRQDLDLAERFIPDILHHLIGHLVIADIHQPLGQCRDKRTDPDPDHDFDNAREIHLSRGYDAVHCLSRKLRHVEGQCNGHGRQKDGEYHEDPVSSQMAEYFFQGFPLSCFLFHLSHLPLPPSGTVNNRSPGMPGRTG